MRKKNLLLILIALLSVSALVGLSACSYARKDFGATKSDNAQDIVSDMTTFELLEEFCAYTDRNYASAGSYPAAQYLSRKLLSCGLQPLKVNGSDMKYTPAGDGDAIIGADAFKADTDIVAEKQKTDSLNLYFRRPADTDSPLGTVIISAHYDNLFGSDLGRHIVSATGAYDNAAAVAVLLRTAQEMSGMTCEYDVIFSLLSASTVVADGAVYYGWYGASRMYATLERLGMANDISLAINLWRLGGGKNNYMYSYDKATSYNNLFYEAAEVNGLDFKDVPEYKRAFSADYAVTVSGRLGSPTGTLHIGMLNDSLVSMNKGVPTLTYLSLDWSDVSNPGYTEYEGFSNCALTDGDTLENMVLVSGGGDKGKQAIAGKLGAVVASITSTLTGDNGRLLGDALALADKELKSLSSAATALYYTGLGILIASIVSLVIAYFVANRKNAERLAAAASKTPPSSGNGNTPGGGSPFEEYEDNGKIFEDFD